MVRIPAVRPRIDSLALASLLLLAAPSLVHAQAKNENGPTKPPATPCGEACLEARHMREPQFYDEKTGVVGLRGSYTRVRASIAGASGNDDGWGMTFAGSSVDYTTRYGIARHGSAFWAIGGGSGGFEGALGAKLAVGWRLPAGEDQGPVLRIGMQGWLQGNDLLYSSLLELPLGQLGWQFTRGKTVIEVGVQAGPVLTGRYSVGDDASRKLGSSFEGTVYGALHFEHLRVDASFMRIETKHPVTDERAPIDFARATLCALGSPIGVCGDVWSYSGLVRAPDATAGAIAVDARALYLGVLVGVTER
jgi:hypothetical protein